MADIPVSQNDRRSAYVATAGQTVFPYDFPIYDEDHLKVTKKVAATGVESVLTLTTDYTVSGVEEVGGGNVTLVSGAAVDDVIVVEGNTPIERLSDYQQGGGIRSAVLNEELDLFTFMVQEVRRAYDRTARLLASVADNVSAVLPAPVAGRSLKWSSDGLSIVNSDNDPDTLIADATAQANAAAASATAAANSATSASGSATTASTKASEAAASASAAAASAALIQGFKTIFVSGQSDVVADATADTLTLAAGTGIAITTDASTDTITITATGGGVETITAGENLTAGDAVYLDNANLRGGGAGKWYKIDTDATGPVKIGKVRGIALATITSGNTGSAQVGPGVITGLTGLTAGQLVYASGTAGAMTQTEPAVPTSGTQNAVVIMGHALSTTTMQFEPWHDVVFQARNSALAVDGAITVEHWTDGGARERVARAYIGVPSGYTSDLTTGKTASSVPASGTPANAIDDNTGTKWSSGVAITLNTDRFIVDFGAGNEQDITKITYKAPASYALQQGELQWSANGSSWNDVGTFSPANNTTVQEFTFAATGTNRRYWSILATGYAYGGAGYGFEIDELEMMGASAAREEPVDTGSATIDATSTSKVTVKFADASNANQDTKTTFYNRTNATRDLIAEVTL